MDELIRISPISGSPVVHRSSKLAANRSMYGNVVLSANSWITKRPDWAPHVVAPDTGSRTGPAIDE